MINYLKRIDDLIELPSELHGTLYLEQLSHLIQELEQIEEKESYQNFLFAKENEISTQRFISFCFIRIIGSVNYSSIEGCKHQVFKLILSSTPEITGQAGIVEKTETYQKEKLLRGFIKEREKEFGEHLLHIGDVSSLTTYQQNFRKFGSNRKNSIISVFCESVLSKSNLDNLFAGINDYLSAAEENKYQKFLSVKEILEFQISEAESIGTKYSTQFVSKAFQRIKALIASDAENSPYFLPSSLEIFKTEKKYPFYVGMRNNLNFGILKKGKGYAHNVIVKITDYNRDALILPIEMQLIGNITSEFTVVEFEYEVQTESDVVTLEIEVLWSSSNEHVESYINTIELLSQAKNIPWERIKLIKPYTLEPVETDSELIGRDIILQKLKSMLALPLGSAYIFGQRRVGKTSIVKTLLSSNVDKNLLIHYIEAGDWNDAQNAFSSMNNLAEKICKKIKRHSPKFNSLSIPSFQGSFNKITDFFDEVLDIDNEFKLLLILDEFDRISNSLYERGDIGKSFVLTLRSISNRPQFGFILVGGEKLEFILSQWQEFNKYTPIRVDYFSKERDWDDFKKLIRKPVEGILDISDDAINCIFEETAGNPYFTKKICMELFSNMVNNRDIHVTKKEVLEAILIARNSSNIGATDFSHFWEDGIKGKVEIDEETSVKRRKVLIAMTHILRNEKSLTKDCISDIGLELGLQRSEVDKYLMEFDQRKILGFSSNKYYFIVNFFKEWLISGGMEKIITTFEEEQRVSINQHIEEKTRVKREEISALLPNLRTYKGSNISADHIRDWLNQFDDVFDQRLMFKLLSSFKLYTESEIRGKLQTLGTFVTKEFVKRGAIRVLDNQKKKRDDILVSFLDKSPAKGATYFTKLFSDENNVYADNACFPDAIAKKVIEKPSIKCLVIIDDFIGSGGTVISGVVDFFDDDLCRILQERNIFVVFGVVTGFSDSIENIEKKIDYLGFDFKVAVVDILTESDKCFSNNSSIFSTPAERKRAKEICIQKGELLEPKFPLGYSQCEALLAFPMNCPNNSLPIFWKKTSHWNPLFERN